MSSFVVDTNVLVVANENNDQADDDCILSCVNKLEAIKNSSVVVVDDQMLIFDEYRKHASMSGQPGVGDAFMKWVWEIQATDRCERVPLTSQIGADDMFDQIPPAIDVSNFDRSDRKFLAVACASTLNPTILNAVDSDWTTHAQTFRQNGINIEFLCPQHTDEYGINES